MYYVCDHLLYLHSLLVQAIWRALQAMCRLHTYVEKDSCGTGRQVWIVQCMLGQILAVGKYVCMYEV